MIKVMRYNYETGKNRGFYSDHFDKKNLVKVEASISVLKYSEESL